MQLAVWRVPTRLRGCGSLRPQKLAALDRAAFAWSNRSAEERRPLISEGSYLSAGMLGPVRTSKEGSWRAAGGRYVIRSRKGAVAVAPAVPMAAPATPAAAPTLQVLTPQIPFPHSLGSRYG